MKLPIVGADGLVAGNARHYHNINSSSINVCVCFPTHKKVEWNNTQQWWKFESESEKNKIVERGEESWLLSGTLLTNLELNGGASRTETSNRSKFGHFSLGYCDCNIRRAEWHSTD